MQAVRLGWLAAFWQAAGKRAIFAVNYSNGTTTAALDRRNLQQALPAGP